MLIDQLLSAFSLYGLPVLFGALLIGAVGIPMPATMMLLAAGSFVGAGRFEPLVGVGAGERCGPSWATTSAIA
jgi:membrane protein DedA with SNARE-associated domain